MAEQMRKKDAKIRDLEDEMSRAAQKAHERELDLTQTAEQHRESLKLVESRLHEAEQALAAAQSAKEEAICAAMASPRRSEVEAEMLARNREISELRERLQ